MFNSLLNDLNEKGGSVRAYEACVHAARVRIADEPENAAALLLISMAAQRFVEAYDDQPLTVEAASEEREAFGAMVETLDKAFTSGDEAARLAALNKVAATFTAALD